MLRSNPRAALALLLLALPGLGAGAPVPATAFPLQVLRRVPVTEPGTPRALAFAPDGGRAYLAVGRAIVAYAAASIAPAGRIELPGRAVDLVVAAGGDRAYAALRDPAAIAVLSLQPLRVLRTWRLPVVPSALLAGAGGQALYVESAAAGRVLKLDAASGRTLDSTHLDGQLQQMVGNGYGHLFVAVADRDVVDVLDTHTLRLAGTFPVPCPAPTGLAMDPVGRRLFVSCAGGGVAVIDTDIGYTFQQLPAAAGTARGLFVFHPQGKTGWKGAAFFAGARGVLGAVRMLAFIRYADGGALSLPAGSEVLAFDPERGRLWVALSKSASGTVAGTLLILGTAPTPGVPP
jgi:DNA-binding beta-propeller fold protein YncE